MNHITEDKLLEFALGISSNQTERAEIETHLVDCQECRLQLNAIQRNIMVIGGIRGPEPVLRMPSAPYQPVKYAVLKVAALVFLGFLVGMGTSSLTHREPVYVLPSYLKLSPPADSLMGCVVSDATEINAGYYGQILEGQK
jgi:hypothetical protein